MASRRKLGILISCPPTAPNFQRGLQLAGAALGKDVDVYLYCIDDAVSGLDDETLRTLGTKGLKLYACAYGAQRRRIPIDAKAMFAGLTVVNDIISGTDRFVSFN